MSVGFEELKKVLDHSLIEVAPSADKPGEFDREVCFEVNGTRYSITWYTNVAYLNIGEALVVFDGVKQSSTWPNHYKVNLHFSGDNGRTVAVIPVQKYA